MALLDSLGQERERWEAGSETFKNQMSTIVGDVLLSSAFMAYAGKSDIFPAYWAIVSQLWREKTSTANIAPFIRTRSGPIWQLSRKKSYRTCCGEPYDTC